MVSTTNNRGSSEPAKMQRTNEPKILWRCEQSATGDVIDVLVFQFDKGVSLEIHGPEGERFSNWVLTVVSFEVGGAEIVKAFSWGRANKGRIDAMFRERTGHDLLHP